jgi:ribokinase
VQILTPNETEAAAILGRPLRLEAVEDEARSLRDLGFGTVVITLGAAGVAVADREGWSYRVEAPVVNAVDSTAAGDAFSGALAACLIADLDEAEAIRRGVEYASEAVCRPGAQSSFPLS